MLFHVNFIPRRPRTNRAYLNSTENWMKVINKVNTRIDYMAVKVVFQKGPYSGVLLCKFFNLNKIEKLVYTTLVTYLSSNIKIKSFICTKLIFNSSK